MVRSRTLEPDCLGSDPGSLLPRSVTLGKSLKLSVTQFSHLSSEHHSASGNAKSLAQFLLSAQWTVVCQDHEVLLLSPDPRCPWPQLPGGPGRFWTHPLRRLVDSSHHGLMYTENLVPRAQHIRDPLISPSDGGWIEGILQMRKRRLRKVLCPRQPQQVSRRSRPRPPGSPRAHKVQRTENGSSGSLCSYGQGTVKGLIWPEEGI